jgi:hypothetical protein
MRSIHVPASVVQKLFRFAQWATPFLLTAVLTWIGLGWNWIRGRVDIGDVGDEIAPVSKSAKQAAADALHATSLANVHETELVALWRDVVLLHAELRVQREYSRANNKGELIEEARKFYGDAYDTERDTRPNNPPSKSAAIALRLTWRPR